MLTADHQSHGNVEYGDERATALQSALEAGL